MSKDSRLTDSAGKKVSFTCENYRFSTNIHKGHRHGTSSKVKGSVFEEPLVHTDGGYSLWVEHVIEKDSEDEMYWLMWYDADGIPTIPLSSVFSKANLEKMMGNIARFAP